MPNLTVILANLLTLMFALSYKIPASIIHTYWLLNTVVSAIICTAIWKESNKQESYRESQLALPASICIAAFSSGGGVETIIMVAACIVYLIIVLRFRYDNLVTDILLTAATAFDSIKMVSGDWHSIGGDLLPIVNAANVALISGNDPYNTEYLQITSGPFFYLPGQWLPYLIPATFKIDPRYLNVTIFVVCILIVRVALPRRISIGTIFPVMFSGLFIIAGQRTYMYPYWILICVLSYGLATQRLVLTAVALGLVMATRQTALAYPLIVALGLISRVDLRRLAFLFLVSGAVFMLLLLPFIISNPETLIYIYLTGPAKAMAVNASNSIATEQLTLFPYLRVIITSPQIAQILAVCVVSFSQMLIKPFRLRLVVCSIGLADFFVGILGPQSFYYYYGSTCLLFAFSECRSKILLGPGDRL